MRIRFYKAFCLALTAILLPNIAFSADLTSTSDPFIQLVRQHIKTQLTKPTQDETLICQGEIICGLKLIPIFYQERRYAPVWLDSNGLRPAAKILIHEIQQVHPGGLHPDDYHASILNILLTDYDFWPQDLDNVQAAIWADLDVLLTDAFLLIGAHLSGGRVDPETLHTDLIPNGSANVTRRAALRGTTVNGVVEVSCPT